MRYILVIIIISLIVVAGSLCGWVPGLFSVHIWIESRRYINLYATCLGYSSLQPIFSGINDHIRRRYVAADSIGRSLQPGHWLQTRNPSTQWCRVINALAACIAMEPSLRHCQVVFDHRSLAFNPAECRATSITRKAWRWNRCSRRWLDHAAANARLHGTSSTRKGTWTVIITSKDSLLKT